MSKNNNDSSSKYKDPKVLKKVEENKKKAKKVLKYAKVDKTKLPINVDKK